MAKLIDRDALQVWLVKMLNAFDEDNDPREIKREMFHRVLSKVRKMPIIDAVPVVHGRWIKLREASEWDQKRCSVCGDVSCCQGNYCMNCGAKMDGDDNDGRRSDN